MLFAFRRLASRNLCKILHRTIADVTKKRNVGVIAHIDAGKTTTTERMLNLCGMTRFVGDVDAGNTVTDYMDQERERGITIKAASITLQWKDCRINLIDTPGHVDFTMEVERSLKVMDGAIIVIDSVEGVQAQTETVWKQASKNGLCCIGFINKLDREGSDFSTAVKSFSSRLGVFPLCTQLPIGSGNNFVGCIDLISMKALIWDAATLQNPKSGSLKQSHLPTALKLSQYALDSTCPPFLKKIIDSSLLKEAEDARETMIETLADLNESFMEKYIDCMDRDLVISPVDIQTSIRTLTLEHKVFPILFGSSLRGRGVEPLLDAIHAYLPSPLDRQELNVERNTVIHSLDDEKDKKTKKHVKPQVNDDLDALIKLADVSDLCCQVFKIIVDKDKGPIAFARVYSGRLASRQPLVNTSKGKKERALHLLHIFASDYEVVEFAEVGDIVGIVGLKHTSTGDTLVNEGSLLESYHLPSIHIPDPVYMVTVEPENLIKQQELDVALKSMVLEDPSLKVDVDSETSSTIIKGMGELHLEVIVDKLRREFNINLDIGKVSVAFRNGIRKSSRQRLVFDRVIGDKKLYADIEAIIEPMDGHEPAVIEINDAIADELDEDMRDSMIDALESSCCHGPLGGYPIVGCKIKILKLHPKSGILSSGSLRAAACALVPQLVSCSEPVLLEPIMKMEISVPTSHVGPVLNDLCVTRRANINEVKIISGLNQRQIIDADAPFERILGYTVSLRSITKGEANCSIEYSRYEEVDVSRTRALIGK